MHDCIQEVILAKPPTRNRERDVRTTIAGLQEPRLLREVKALTLHNLYTSFFHFREAFDEPYSTLTLILDNVYGEKYYKCY